MNSGIYIGLGANLGDPLQTLRDALTALAGIPKTQVLLQSSFYRSKPMGPADQPDYVNAVAELATALAPSSLLAELQRIENDFGRRRERRWGARTLDLDILLFGAHCCHTETLTIPHPGLEQRDFVVIPLLEIAPDLILPNKRTLQDISKNLDDHELQRISC